MLRLLNAELRRITHRRITAVLLMLAVLGLGLAGWASWTDTKPPTAAEQAAQAQSWQQAKADWETNGQRYIAQCEESNAVARKYGEETTPCSEVYLPPQPADFKQAVPAMSTLTGSSGYVLGGGLTLIGILLGASVVAAEFTTRSMATWLVFEPRRDRVAVSKLLAILAFMVLLCLVADALTLSVLWGVGHLNHLQQDLTPPMQLRLLTQYLLGNALAIGAALGAAGLALFTRHTAAVLGLVGLWGFGTIWGNDSPLLERLSLANNVPAWMDGRYLYWVRICEPGTENCTMVERSLTRGDGGLVLFGAAALAILLGWLTFRRRDVA